MNEPTPLDFLRAVYLNEGLPLGVRLRAAIEAAPYVHPKLSATAILSQDNFADRLECAIARSGMNLIEASPLPQPDWDAFANGAPSRGKG